MSYNSLLSLCFSRLRALFNSTRSGRSMRRAGARTQRIPAEWFRIVRRPLGPRNVITPSCENHVGAGHDLGDVLPLAHELDRLFEPEIAHEPVQLSQVAAVVEAGGGVGEPVLTCGLLVMLFPERRPPSSKH